MSDAPVRKKRIVLADVAREAGVSVQTASHVMAKNMTVRLPESTRKRVIDAAVRVGYSPNLLAQSMRRGKTNVVGVWMPVDRLIFTYLRFIQAINSRTRADGYEFMITGLEGSTAYGGLGEAPRFWPVDGLIAVDAGKAVRLFREDPNNDNTPVVVLGLEEFSNADSVSWDVAGAAHAATSRLIDAGSKKIVHVTLDWILENYPREQRRSGYAKAMQQMSLECKFIPVGDETSVAAKLAVADFLLQSGCPDAFFCATDTLAIGVTNALINAGFRVPEDCKVWGFGDYPEGAEFRVPLSTIRAPVEKAVDQAWVWLRDRMERPDVEHRLKMLDMDLIERASTGNYE